MATKEQRLIATARKLMSERVMMAEAKSGSLRIEHKVIAAGNKMPVVPIRVAMFQGMSVCSVVCTTDYVQHWLIEEGQGCWMSDQPCELIQMHSELAYHARGDVLIGGLGLGILANMVSRRSAVRSVTVIEQSEDVINLIEKYLASNVRVVHDDIHKYMGTITSGQYNVALLDTWQATGEWSWQTEVVPLRRKGARHIGKIVCWQEDTMRGQVHRMLYRMADMDEEKIKMPQTCHYYAFRCAARDMGIRVKPRLGIPLEPTGNPQLDSLGEMGLALAVEEENYNCITLRALASHFLVDVGSRMWEQNFGRYWDEAFEVEESYSLNNRRNV